MFAEHIATVLCYYVDTKADMKDGEFHYCHHQIFHSSIAHILQSLKPVMTKPEVVQCPDGHFCHAISLGPYIGNYLEQYLLSHIIQGWCVKWVLCI